MTVMSVDGKQRSIAYWDERSKGYNLATRLALNNCGNAVRRNILHFLDGDRRLRILDAGCGAGYAAVIAAQMGHDVTALDFSARMLERVESNAGKYGVDIETVKGDICSMPFDDTRFDLVISKDTLWCIDDPVTAYCEFMRVLRPGGHVLVMDGNWYLDLFDDDYRRRREYVGMKSGKRGNMHANTNIDNVDFDIMRDLARDMPLSRVRRPAWDVSTLLGLGAEVGEVRSLDDDP
ncbi:MAG: class I SAM-dependent methyltransferase, partial [Candidatus Methanomethylophilaceae archaeon]|nr:class I SAM-dependent methyltransferase [Candidatus Methanomethylophilaceae archaeon]